ncbi:hypothetical protein AUR64_17930 [Haloprofundus marisrubri]|uniref:DUF8101 domain-containing protein n=1 Tax=Haloprofundus marisrubri TaxID=1514971 RepID=A0A0W1R5M8_9EURY|nr:hypothetical protein [Haloprofundus marisrubri]KTG08556.1 hypothetical protein AUR64_17930 [Haloprofundus marisrubri]
MTDLSPDVHAVLTQLLDEAREHVRAGDSETAYELVETGETVTKNKVPAGELKARLLHGWAELPSLVEHDPAVATEYLQSMQRLLDEQSG